MYGCDPDAKKDKSQSGSSNPADETLPLQNELQVTPSKSKVVSSFLGSRAKESVAKSTQKQQQGSGAKPVVDQPKRIEKLLDLTIEPPKSNRQIYRTTSSFTLTKPYATVSDYQRELEKYRALQNNTKDKKYLAPQLDKLAVSLLELRNRNWCRDLVNAHQQYIRSLESKSFDHLVKHKLLLQLREQFNWLVWAVAHQYSRHGGDVALPRCSTTKWSEGFEFKGVFIQLLPIEDASHVLSEIKALAQVQVELLQALSNLEPESGNLVKQTIVPLLTAVKFGAFVIYGTPMIYAQDASDSSPGKNRAIEQSQAKAHDLQQTAAGIISYSQTRVEEEVLKKQHDFLSYLHKKTANSGEAAHLSKFAILQNLRAEHLTPVMDFDELAKSPTKSAPLNYLVRKVADCIRSIKNVSDLLFVIPTSTADDICFEPFPDGRPQLKFAQIKSLIARADHLTGAQGASLTQPKGDTYLSPRSPNTGVAGISRRGESSHPTDDRDEDVSILHLQKSGWSIQLIQTPGGGSSSAPPQLSENKRATQLLTLSHQLRVGGGTKDSAFTTPKKLASQLDSNSIFGSVLIRANYNPGLKLLPAVTMVHYPEGVESILRVSLDSVAKLLNSNHEQVLNIAALKELMRRQGLNKRFLWPLLTKVTLKKARSLILVSLLLSSIKRFVYEKVAQKCRIESGPYYNASKSDCVFETVAMCVNALLKNKFAKYRQVFEETLLALFLNRLKILPFAATLGLETCESNYLGSKDALEHVIQSAAQNATLFMNSVQSYFGVQFLPEFVRQYRQDCYQLTNKQQPLTCSDFKQVELSVLPVMTLREQAFFVLARISMNESGLQSGKKQQSATQLPKINRQTFGPTATEDCGDTSRANHSYSKQKQDTHRNFQNLNLSATRSFNLIDLSKKRQYSVPPCEITLPSLLYRVSGAATQGQILRANYDFPSVDNLNEWVIVLDSLLHDCFSCCFDNSDQVMIEALNMQILTSMLVKQDLDDAFKILQKVGNILHDAIAIAPEIFSFYMMLHGLHSDSSGETEFIDSERSYLGALISLFSIVGDPRGRGNSGLPIMMFLVWKLQILAQAGKKTQDSELAEELFDSCLHGFLNYKRHYKTQTQQVVQAQERAYQDTERSQLQHQLPNDKQSTLDKELLRQTKIDNLAEHFDIKQYRKRAKKLMTAGGFLKTAAKQSNTDQKSSHKVPHSLVKSTSIVKQKEHYDAELSDIEVQIESEDLADSVSDATKIVSIPFPHWMINRQLFSQQHLSLAREDQDTQKQMLRQLAWDTLNNLHALNLMEWLVSYNPFRNASGLQWDSQTIKEFCFGQQSQLFSNSGSSAAFSHSGRSLNSSRLMDATQQYSQRRRHLGSYSQIFNKDVGGIVKNELTGIVYIWGSDQSGQLGLDNFCPQQISKQLSMSSNRINTLKLLHPRICVPLKDEIIKEVCCGYSFTFAVNHYGQTFSWGANECGQLGLGPSSMGHSIVRCPQQNPFLSDVLKISAGNEHALALTKRGELYVWGSANLTGLNDEKDRPTPTVLSKFTNQIRQFACGGLHSMVLTKAGQIYTWGSNEGGQLGLSQSIDVDCVRQPTLLKSLVDKGQVVTQIAAGETHSVALTREHKIWGWGMSMYGQLGLGFSSDSFEPGVGLLKSKVLDPQEITPFLPKGTNVMQIFCGAAFTLFQTKQGELYGCGINDLGQLGLDTYVEEMQLHMMDRQQRQQQQMSTDVVVPSRVICFEKMNVQSVACGENHSLAVIGEDKNMLWSWGMYKNGQLGLGQVTIKMNPRPVQTLCASHINSIAAGSQHSVALLGEASTLANLTQTLFVSTDTLSNNWSTDVRNLAQPHGKN